jgi:hypothetical protein
MSRRRGWFWWLVALFHGCLFAALLIDAVQQWPASRQRFDPAAPPDRSQVSAEVARLLPRLLMHVPEDAPLTLVTALVQVFPFQLHTEPRPTQFLQMFEEALIDHFPTERHRQEARKRFDELEGGGRLYSPERLRESLRNSRYLLTFFAGDLTEVAEPAELLPLEVLENDRQQRVAVYRILTP